MKRYVLLALQLVILGVFTLGNGSLGMTRELSVTPGADIVSRYNWRGLDLGDAVSLQPYLRLECGGLKAGFWGSYSTEYEEIDTWGSYTLSTPRSGSISAIITDIYVPSSGNRFFNFNDYDDPDGPGAHSVELGLSYGGPPKFPIVVSGYVNVYNDAGNNAYFQLDYPFKVKDVDMGIFLGAANGSMKNPAVYCCDDFEVINIGLKATRRLQVNPNLELPLSATFILNPCQEKSYLVFGLSI